MGKARRDKKLLKKHAPYSSPKPSAQGIKRRQHSQNGKLGKSAEASSSSQKPNGKLKQPLKIKVPFTRHDRVLLVGEGDFSFTSSLVKHHEVGALIATSYDDKDALKEKYPLVDDTLQEISRAKSMEPNDAQDQAHDDDGWSGFSPASDNSEDLEGDVTTLKSADVMIAHGIDATSLSKAHRKTLNPHAPFTKIVFNFPHTGGLSTDVNRQVRANQELLVAFFNAAKPLLATKARPAKPLSLDQTEDIDEHLDEDEAFNDQGGQQQELSSGQILVTLFEGEPYTLWNIRDLARHCGLQVIESFKFPWSAYPGYKHARTIGDIVTGKDRSDEGKRKGAWRGEERDARCYVLGLKEELSDTMGRKRRKRDAGDSDASD